MQIKDKVFIVTGGASGLGEGTARMLAANGARVVIADMQAEKGEAVASEIGGAFVKCDVSSEADGQAVVAAAVSMGKLRALVNCAGIAPAEKTVGKQGAHKLDVFTQDHHGQPGGQLQHDPPGGRCDVQERAREHRRARRADQHRQRGRLRRPDRPGCLQRQQGGRRA